MQLRLQRLLRGRVQSCDPQSHDSFWTWREAMYGLVQEVVALRAQASKLKSSVPRFGSAWNKRSVSLFIQCGPLHDASQA